MKKITPSHKPDVPVAINVLPARPVVEILPPVPVKQEADYSAAITAWATVALVIATGVLAYLTWVLARATSRASIIVTIEPNPAAMNFVDIHIVNEGSAAAYDVHIEFDPNLPQKGGQSDKINFPSNLRIIAAGQRLISSLCEAFVIMDQSYILKISWKSSPKSRFRQSISYPIDLSHMKEMSRLGNDPAIQSASEIKKIRELLEKIASGRSRLRVDSYSQIDRDSERKQNFAQYSGAGPAGTDGSQSQLQSRKFEKVLSALRKINPFARQ